MQRWVITLSAKRPPTEDEWIEQHVTPADAKQIEGEAIETANTPPVGETGSVSRAIDLEVYQILRAVDIHR